MVQSKSNYGWMDVSGFQVSSAFICRNFQLITITTTTKKKKERLQAKCMYRRKNKYEKEERSEIMGICYAMFSQLSLIVNVTIDI